jgi:hypothetical protein
VVAFLAEGIPLGDALAHAEIDPEVWADAAARWARIIEASAGEDDGLVDAFDGHRIAAHAWVIRPLPPLDEEYGAYVTFMQAFCRAPDPDEFLAVRGLSDHDMFRLQGLWQERMAADPELREAAGDAWRAPPTLPPAVRPDAPRLRPRGTP